MCKPTSIKVGDEERAPEEWDSVDPRDLSTPDDWVKRHPALVRLTGRHPFNVEPPLSELMRHGHQTPSSLHYVRNHGAVPIKFTPETAQSVRDSWRVAVYGEMLKSTSMSMDDLAKLPYRDVSVLLVCAGNRRKEQNMMKRTIGFNWGPSGIGMSLWGGCYMADLLAACGAPTDPAEQFGYHVVFRGPKGELPAGEDGSYGTSIPLQYAMNKANDVVLAWNQNDCPLKPDHGFPLRIVIPGFIGGRMVKWLEDISISKECSQNHYHFKDNRVLPVNVTPESAEAEGWWYKPDYIINELSINSAIARPAHDEVVSIEGSEEYVVEGYAYSGGGRKIIRVELTLDNGKSWTLVKDENISHPPTSPTKYGMYWGWCMWKIPVPRASIVNAQTVRVRAWDNAMNTQPSNLTWNVMGMLNNPWFTVLMHRDGENARKAEHPTMPGQQKGGWMTDEAVLGVKHIQAPLTVDAGAAETEDAKGASDESASVAASSATVEDDKKAAQYAALSDAARKNVITREELAKHNDEKSCWIDVNGVVYDATPYLEEHPGGGESILMLAGQDATEDFAAIHSVKAWKILEPYAIGVIGDPAVITKTDETVAAPTSSKIALSASAKVEFELVKKETLSHDSYRLRFALPTDDHVLGLPVGKHILVYGRDADNKLVARAYTPTTGDEVKGYVDFVIKSYRPSLPKFPKGGALSQYLCDRIAIGDKVKMRGPLGKIEYVGRGSWKNGDVLFEGITHVGLVAGGTGVTPCLQVVTAALNDADDTTEVSLILANQTEQDILCREELETLAKAFPDRFHLWYTLDRPPAENWAYSTGFVTEAMIAEHLPKAADSTLIMSCGPPPMINYACKPNYDKLGHAADHQFYF